MAEKKEERAVETVLNYVHKNHIALQDEDMKRNGEHFRKVLEHLILLMKEEDPLFNRIYSRICGAGSYYDGLKVGKPEEFDMDIVIRLPINYEEAVIENANPVPAAFTKVKITRALDLLRQHPDWTSAYRSMDKWRDKDGFLLQTEFRQWVEGVVNKALNRLEKKEPNCFKLKIQDSEYTVSLKKSGPALTFAITILAENVVVDVDFVPVIEFTYPKWPPQHVRRLDDQLIAAKKTSWFIVPKPRKTANPDGTIWRLAFHEQERQMISGKSSLKPVCRLLKKLRDSQGLNIASYYLKTLFLWEIDKNKSPDFWNKKHGHLFMHMLKVLEQSLECGKIPYYWDKRYNLLDGFQDAHKQNLACRLKNIIANIEKNVSGRPCVIAKYIVSKEDYEVLIRNSGMDVAVEVTPQMATRPNSSTDGTTVRTAGTQVVNSRPDGHCSACVAVLSKLDDIMSSLTALSAKVDTLERKLTTLCEKNAGLHA